jgi:hypothetical protein
MSSVRNILPSALLGVAAWIALPARSVGQTPELTRLMPYSARPGETVSLTLHGKDLLKPAKIWTSFDSSTDWETPPAGKDGSPPKPDGRSVTARLGVSASAPLGVGFLRLPTATGFSGPLLFLVDDLSVVVKSRRNTSLENAQGLDLPTAVEGASDTGGSDFYRFNLRKGEAFSAEVYACRLGSKMDPLLRLLDGKGREILRADDTQGLSGDCRLRYTAPGEGPVVLEIRDASFAGGAERFYHMRVGDFPLLTAVFPPVAEAGAQVSVQVCAADAEAIAPVEARAPAQPDGTLSFPVRYGPGKPAAFASLRLERGPVVLEAGRAEGADLQSVSVPCVLAGRLALPGERDVFQIEARKDERLTFLPLTREIGSPALLYVAVTDGAGALLAENDAGATGVQSDVPLIFKVPRDGAYRIKVEDLARRGGADFVYGLRVEKAGATGFELSAASDRFLAAKGGSFTAKITAQRRGVNGPITLELASGDGRPLPSEIRLEQNVIEKGKNETTLQVFVPAEVPSGTFYHVRVVGKAKEGEVVLSAVAAGPKGDANKAQKDQVLQALLSMPFPPRMLREAFPVCVGPEAPDFFKIELASPAVELPKLVGRRSFVVRQTAIDGGFEGNAQLAFSGLPEGVSMRAEPGRGGRIKGQVDFICEVTGPENIAAGTHTFELVASANFKGVHKEVRLPKVPLRVVEPLALSAVLGGPLAPGGRQKLKIVATRYAEEEARPIQLQLKNLPEGVSSSGGLEIPAGASELTIELSAAADRAPGQRLDSLVISGLTRIKDADVSVDSTPVLLEVKK